MDKNNLLPVIVIVAILAVGGLLIVNAKKSTSTDNTPTPVVTEENSMVTEETTLESTNAMENVKTFEVSGTSFAFDLKEIRVNQGDTVRIVFTNAEGFHDWVLDEFNAKTAQIPAGQTETIEFVADKLGTFEYYCSVGQHRANGMVGNLIVE